jgi:pyruvate formate lyase activating enzyme
LASAGSTHTPQENTLLAAGSRNQVQGVVARIARLAIHDGPGIRTVVFLKGCPLHCCWCASPETQRFEAELLIDSGRCTGCGACIAACPLEAIARGNNGVIVTDRSICDGCGRCTAVCATGARRMVGQTVSLSKILQEIEKDEVFYYRSGGGVTLSGGEPLAQAEFSAKILKACAARGIHTAMETSACVAWEKMSPLLGFLNLVFVDVKHMDDAAHRMFTGMGNWMILENIWKLAKMPRRPTVIVRVPVIPGFNDSRDNLEKTAEFVKETGHIRCVELLPFHRYGLHHYEAMGRVCELPELKPPSEQHLQRLAAIFAARGIPIRIGG